MTTPGTSASGSSRPQSGRLPPKISGRSASAQKAVSAPPKPRPLPSVLPYPKLHPLAQCEPHLKDHLCYFVRHYGTIGISVLVIREPKLDKVTVLCGDWAGNNLDLDQSSQDRLVQAAFVFVQEDLKLFLRTMQLIKLSQAQFFLAIDGDGRLSLVDMQVTLDKLVGPGMIRDIFGNVYRTQEVIKVEALDDRSLEYLNKGTGNYEGELIIKPSKFAVFSPAAGAGIVPLYAEVRR